jgi:Tfp pilus assembly protein PilN
MLKINLYPGPARKRFFRGLSPKVEFSFPLKDRAVQLSIAFVVVLFVLALLSYLTKAHTISNLKEDIEIAESDSIKYAESIRLINDIKDREEWIRGQINIISKVDQHRYLWPKIMSGVNDALPSVTWLTKLETLSPFPQLTFTVEGISFSNIEVADFMRRLSRLKYIEGVKLVRTREFLIEGISTMAFTIECYYNKEPDSGQVMKGGGVEK